MIKPFRITKIGKKIRKKGGDIRDPERILTEVIVT